MDSQGCLKEESNTSENLVIITLNESRARLVDFSRSQLDPVENFCECQKHDATSPFMSLKSTMEINKSKMKIYLMELKIESD